MWKKGEKYMVILLECWIQNPESIMFIQLTALQLSPYLKILNECGLKFFSFIITMERNKVQPSSQGSTASLAGTSLTLTWYNNFLAYCYRAISIFFVLFSLFTQAFKFNVHMNGQRTQCIIKYTPCWFWIFWCAVNPEVPWMATAYDLSTYYIIGFC